MARFTLTILMMICTALCNAIATHADVVQPRVDLPFSQTDPIDKQLFYLDEIAGGYPPQIKSKADLENIQKGWKQLEGQLTSRLSASGESFDIELRMGHLYRFGHNLDIKDSLELSETHFQKAIALAPKAIDAYLGLAILYVNTDPSHATKSEELFKTVIKLSKENQPPKAAIIGLFFSYYYQGRAKESIALADEYIARHPDDEGMKRLRQIVIDVVNRARR